MSAIPYENQSEMVRAIGQFVGNYLADNERSYCWLQRQTEGVGCYVSRSAISQLVNGKRQSISMFEWLALAKALDVKPHVLAGMDETFSFRLGSGDAA